MDILTGCTGNVAAEVVKCTAKPVIRHVGYLFRFKKIVDDLTKATKDLQLVQQKVKEAIKLAKMNTEVVEKDVEGWLTDVDQLMKEVQALENKVQGNLRFCNDWCPDWIRQYKLCKEAIQKTNVVQELQKKGNFSKVAQRALNPGKEIFSSIDFEVFASRKSTFQQIMEALRDDNNKRIGLHGIGGIGKTTLVNEVYKEVKRSNDDIFNFNDIVMTVVSQTPDVRRIHGEIAGCLNLNFEDQEKEIDTARANRICLRIKNAEKILIIVDDVWTDVKLEDYGIPSFEVHEGCKMLLTTRREHVCNLMHCQRKIRLNFLLEEESLALMKKTAKVDDCPDLNDNVVQEVVKECKGLPIAIITVGKALIRKSLNDWKAALNQLRNSRLVDIEGVDENDNAYACLKWSYDQLKPKTKLCLLLCSLFPEDYNIPIEELTRYVMGLEEDECFDSLNDVRIHVLAAINSLKDSSLLLKGSSEAFVKMHDIVRDIGLWITSRGENEFKLRACTRLERNTNFESATAISLIDFNTKQLPNKLVCPRLNILLLGGIRSSKEISNTLFEGMNCLKVLTLHDKILSSQSLELLTNLRTLYLRDCNFSDDLSSLGKLKRLETLSFCGCGMVALPSELGEMASLKMLDLTNCVQLEWIPPNVIQSLSKLEELIINGSFKNWDVEGTTSRKSNAKLSELNLLPSLGILFLELNPKHLPKGFVFPDLQRYCISINHPDSHLRNFLFSLQGKKTNLRCINSSILEIRNCDSSSINACKLLFRTVEYIRIESCDTECIVDTTGGNDQYVSFSNLVELNLQEMSCLRTICEGPNQYVSFSNLTVLDARRCPRLISLFSPSLAQSLKKLKQLSLHRCREMKQIISEEEMILESHGQPICLSKLETLEVMDCSKLECIFPISVARGLQQLERLNLGDLPRLKKVFGQNREGEVGDCEIESHHQPTGFPKLKTIQVWDCRNLVCLSTARDLPQLESLELRNLPQLKKVFGQNREGEVGDCEIESHHQPSGFPKLKTIEVVNCENLEYIFPISIARDLPQLESLELRDLPQLKQVFGHERGGDDGDGNNSVLSKLRNLRLKNLPELVSLGGANSSVWPSLESLAVANCPKVKLSFFANVEANVPALQKLQNLQILSLRDWNAISFDGIQGLSNLEELKIENCGGIQEVIKLEGLLTIKGEQQDLLLPRLKKMLLIDLLELRCIWKGVTKLINLNNLEDLKVIRCKKLTHLFTPALTQSLQKLKFLEIEWCDELEHVIVENAEESESYPQPLCFPKPNVVKVKVESCNKLKCLFHVDCWNLVSIFLTLEELELKYCGGLQEVFNFEGFLAREGEQQDEFFPRLRKMCLVELRELTYIQKGPIQLINFNNLEDLKVIGCKKLMHLFTPALAQSLQKLKYLEIERCYKLEHLIVENAEEQVLSESHPRPLCFPKPNVVKVKVKSCNKLKCLFHVDRWNVVSIFLTLEELELKNCGGLQEVFNFEGFLTREGEQQDEFSPRLRKMCLVELRELTYIWKSPIQLINFNNLEDLKVIWCKKLTHLFTPALAQSLQKLKFLEIERCDELEHIIVENVEEQVSSENHLQPLCFPKLIRVNVRYCNKLKYLFPMTIADSLLELKILIVIENSQLMEVFTHEGDAGVQKDVTLPQLQLMGLKGLPSLVNFCPKNYQFILPKWEVLRVESCKNMRTTFTRTPDRSVLINGEVAQIDKPTGMSANNDIRWTDYPTRSTFDFDILWERKSGSEDVRRVCTIDSDGEDDMTTKMRTSFLESIYGSKDVGRDCSIDLDEDLED